MSSTGGHGTGYEDAITRRRADADAARVRRAGLYLVLASLVALACLAGLVLTMVRVGR